MIVCRDLNDLPSFSESAMTIGSFDGVHQGHRKLLDKVSQIAKDNDYVSIAVTFAPHPRQVLQQKDNSLQLLNTLEEKLELMAQCDIDYVVIAPFTEAFSQITPAAYIESFLIDKFNPSHIVIGYDHKFGKKRTGDINLLKSYAAKGHFNITEIPAYMVDDITISSTKIRKALLNGEIDISNQYLQAPYPLSGVVIRGDQIGRQIGFPTANIQVQDQVKLIPADGVYAAEVRLGERRLRGMLYIGQRPTIDGIVKRVIEVNIFDFEQEIYGEMIRIYLHAYIRDDEKFSDLAALKLQIGKDEAKIREIFSIIDEIQQPELAIAILNYNGVEYLESFLPLMSDSYSGNAKIYVIDNHSTDDSISYLQEWHPEVEIISLDKNYGFAGGYNEGLKHINAPYLAVVNSDLQVTDLWLDPIMAMLKSNSDIACIQPKIKSLENQAEFEYAGAAGGLIDIFCYPLCRGRIFNSVEADKNQFDDATDIFWASGAAMVIRTDLMKAFGGFDADYFAHQEEIDLCWRLKNAGYRIAYEPRSVVYHLGGGTLSYDHPRKIFLNFRNNLVTIMKNESTDALLWKVPIRFFLDIVATFKFMLSGQLAAASSVVRALLYVLGNLGSIFRKRQQVKLIVSKQKIGEATHDGKLKKSIIWSYYVLGKRTFHSL